MLPTRHPVLVGDIGGTNARLAIASWDASTNAPSISAITVLHCADYADFASLIAAYLQQLTEPAPRYACLAIAGPLLDNIGTLTNIGWRVDGDALAQQFKFDHIQLINDFGALAYSVPFLSNDEIFTLRNAKSTSGPISVAGAGTGFGAALLVPNGSDWDLVATEGGHVSFAPTTRREQQVWEFLRGYEQHVSVEHILSGNGIVTLYRALSDNPNATITAAEISEHALADSDPLCSATLELFCEIFGSVAGNIALTHGARGGIYLGGGILPKILPLLQRSQFIERFDSKGIMSNYVKALSIRLITSEYPALKGAAMWFWRQ